MLNKLLRRLKYWRDQDQRQSALGEEMEFHIDALTADLIAEGVTPAEARARARRQFGNPTQQSELAAETWVSSWAADALHDLRYAIRGLLRQPAFALFAVVILALGIGASSTVFTVLNTLVIRALPVHEPERLVWVANSGEEGLSGSTIQVDHLLDTARLSTTIASLVGYMAFYGIGETVLGDTTKLERFTSVPVTCSFLPTLGVQPQLGRNFAGAECNFNGPGSTLLSHAYWQRRFAGRQDIVGSQLLFNGKTVTVAGVLPSKFDFGALFAPGVRVDALTVFPLSPETNRWGNTMSVVGRLKPGASAQAAQSELTSLAKTFEQVKNRNGYKPLVKSLPDYVGGTTHMAIWIIAAAVLVVMGIVCANLASLQLARAAARHKEFAIRTSLGAGRLRLIRQMLVESLLLTSLGCLLGIALSALAATAISQLDTIRVPMLSQIRMDSTSVAFAIGIATLSGLFFGLLPGLQINSGAIHDALKDSTRGGSSGKSHAWTRNALVIGEVAFACILLVSAGLLIRSMLKLMDIHLGFVPDRAVVMRINTPRNVIAETDEMLRRAREIPGVEFAGLTDSMPFGKNRSWSIADATLAKRRENYEGSFVRIVTDGFFPAMGIRILEGRDFTERDLPATDKVVIVNQAIANRYWPGKSALGKEVFAGGSKPARIIGVVENLRHLALEEASGFEFYLSMRQTTDRNGVELVVRSSTSLPTLSTALKQAIQPIDSSVASSEVLEVQSLVSRATSPRRVVLICLTGFALFALLLASLGIYALIAYTVEQRGKEMGIRLALGASSASLKRGVILQTLRLVATGIVVGALVTLPVASAMRGMLFGIEPIDPLSFFATACTFSIVALIAGYLPARRISRIDPLEALRQDG
jgi:predicted permease